MVILNHTNMFTINLYSLNDIIQKSVEVIGQNLRSYNFIIIDNQYNQDAAFDYSNKPSPIISYEPIEITLV